MEKNQRIQNSQERIWQKKRTIKKTQNEIPSDVLGSYTGTPEGTDNEMPTQDADDL